MNHLLQACRRLGPSGRRRFVRVLAILMVIGLFGACSREDENAIAPVRMGYLPMISSLTYFVALDQGYFGDESVEVYGIPMGTSNKIAGSLESGDIEVGVELSVIPLLNQIEKDSDASFVVFSTSLITAEEGFDSVLVLEDSDARDLKDLSGVNVGVFPGTTASNTLLEVFKRKFPNLPPPKPKPMSPSLHLGSLEKGDVEAIHAYEPFLSIGLTTRGMRSIHTSLYAAQISPNPIGVAAVNKSWSVKDPVRCGRVISALDRAAKFISAYPDKARMIMAEYTGTAIEVAKVANIMPMSTSKDVSRDGLDAYFKILLEMGEIKYTPEAASLCISRR